MRPTVDTDTVSIPDRDALAGALTLHTCLRNCFGNDGMAGSCCTVTGRDYIIGPIRDAAALLARLSEKAGRAVPWGEVFVDHAEGSALFPDRPVWQREASYPAIRLDMEDAALPCRFLGPDNLCTVHDIRSTTCANYRCGHLGALLDAL